MPDATNDPPISDREAMGLAHGAAFGIIGIAHIGFSGNG